MSITLPIHRSVLPSGLTVLVETLPYVRTVALGYYLRTGSAAENIAAAGATHFLEHLVFKATEGRSTSDIANTIDMLGGDVDAWTSKEYTSFYAHVLDEHFGEALELLTDIVLRPRFTADDLEMERSVVFEEIKMVEDTPDDLVNEIFVESFWGDHPLGRPILGTPESVRRISHAEILDHYRDTFRPSNLIFVASGNIRPEQLLPFLEREFPDAREGNVTSRWTKPEGRQHVMLREKRELEQVHLCLGMRGMPQEGDQRYAAVLFNTILGGGMSSRLFQRVRESEGLVYSIGSFHNAYLNGGYEAVYAACAPKNTKRVIASTLEELRSFRQSGATEKELVRAKRYLKGSVLLSLESTVSRMSGIARQEYYFGRQFSADEIIQHIDAVTLEDVHRVAGTIVDPESLSLTLLGNLRKAPATVELLRQSVA